MLELLSAAPEVPVIDMLAATGLEASHLSQHLAVLRRYHLIKGERRALQMFYSLTYPQVAELLAVAKQLLTDILGDTREQLEQAAADTAKAGQPTQ